MNHYIPNGGTINAVGCSPRKANELLIIPNTDDGLAMGNRNCQILNGTLFGPKGSHLKE
jgi:hypothetical protein